MTAVSDPSRRYLHLWLVQLSIDRTRRAHPSRTDGRPFALIARQASALRLQAVDAAGEGLGLVPGMSLADARALVPELETADADPAADGRALAALVEACRRYTPSLAVDAPDGADLNITGAARLFGGEAALVADLSARVRGAGYRCRCGVADTPGLAWALARFAEDPVAAPGAAEDILAPLPVEALRLAPEIVASLRGLGLRRIGQILDASARPALARRLGEAALERLDQVLGRRASPLALKLEVEPHSAERRLHVPAVAAEEIVRLIEAVATPLCARLAAERLGGRLFRLELFRVDGAVKRLEVGASRPLRDPARIAALFAERIEALNEGLEADFGFDLIRLHAPGPEAARSEALDLLKPDGGGVGFPAMVDRLVARMGPGGVRRFVPRPETRLPEKAVRLPPFREDDARPWAEEPELADEGAPLRPLSLFSPPQPIEVTAVVPEGAPDRIRWRRLQRRIVAAEGPERLEPEWGRATCTERVRDYYRLEDESGRRYWVFREGRYGEPVEPRWFIHGLLP